MGEGGHLVLDDQEAVPELSVPRSWTIRCQHSRRSMKFEEYDDKDEAMAVPECLAEHMEVPAMNTRGRILQ